MPGKIPVIAWQKSWQYPDLLTARRLGQAFEQLLKASQPRCLPHWPDLRLTGGSRSAKPVSG